MKMAGSSPTVPCASGIPKVSFSSAEHAPIRSVVVYTKNKAEITRVLSFSADKLGLHEVRRAVSCDSLCMAKSSSEQFNASCFLSHL